MFLSLKSGAVNVDTGIGKREILHNINMNIPKGKFISIIGHSGCGKTTLLRVIAGLQILSSGKITYDQQVKEIGLVPQVPSLLPNKTVIENITLPLAIKGLKDETYARDLLKKYGLSMHASDYPNEISGGMKQKASIIRALINKPNLLLMDEPFASIDQYSRELLNIDLADKLRSENTTTILVTHSIEEAVFLSDYIFIMAPKIPSTIVKAIDILLPNNRSEKLKETKEYLVYVSKLREILFSLSKNYYEKE